MAEKNVRFNAELHSLFMKELEDSAFVLETIQKMFAKCYPNADRGPEAKVRRNMSSALRDLENVKLAIMELRQTEES